jgi:hypothetical protein
VRRCFLEAADLPVGRSASTSRASPARKIPRWRRSAASRPSRSSAASRRVRRGRGASSLPRSGRPPGRPDHDHVAGIAGTQDPAIAPQRGVPAEQELGRFEEGEAREGCVVASSKRADLPVGRSASTSRASPARKIPRWRRSAASPAEQELGRFEEGEAREGASSLPRSGRPPGRPDHDHVAGIAGTQDPAIAPQRGVPAEQELGRFEEGEAREGWVVASSKRPTSRSGGARARWRSGRSTPGCWRRPPRPHPPLAARPRADDSGARRRPGAAERARPRDRRQRPLLASVNRTDPDYAWSIDTLRSSERDLVIPALCVAEVGHLLG